MTHEDFEELDHEIQDRITEYAEDSLLEIEDIEFIRAEREYIVIRAEDEDWVLFYSGEEMPWDEFWESKTDEEDDEY